MSHLTECTCRKMHTPPNGAHYINVLLLFVFTICALWVSNWISWVCKRDAKIWITSIFQAKSWSLSLYSIKTRPVFTSLNLCIDTALWCSRALITPPTPWSRKFYQIFFLFVPIFISRNADSIFVFCIYSIMPFIILQLYFYDIEANMHTDIHVFLIHVWEFHCTGDFPA